MFTWEGCCGFLAFFQILKLCFCTVQGGHNWNHLRYMLFGKAKGFVLTLEGSEYWVMFFVEMADYITFLLSMACFSRPAWRFNQCEFRGVENFQHLLNFPIVVMLLQRVLLSSFQIWHNNKVWWATQNFWEWGGIQILLIKKKWVDIWYVAGFYWGVCTSIQERNKGIRRKI